MPTAVTGTVCPTGGAVTLLSCGLASGVGAQMLIQRAVSGESYSPIYSGGVVPFFIDIGDAIASGGVTMSGGGLSSGTAYFWQVSDANGTQQVGPLTPAPTLQVTVDFFTPLLIDLLQTGINNLTMPDGITRAQVFHDMPLGNLPDLPCVTVTMELLQQDTIGIGQNVENPIQAENGFWTMPALARRVWRISVLAKDVLTREFYRDACIAIYEALLPTIFMPLGQNVSHKFQARNSQLIEDLKDIYPGIYIAEIMVEQVGLFNVNIYPGYPIATSILIGMQSRLGGAPSGQFISVSGLVSGS